MNYRDILLFPKFKNISFLNDNYIFLNCFEGNEEIIDLHDTLYNDLLKNHLKSIKYIPHITLGQKENIKNIKLLNEFIILDIINLL